MSDTIFPEPMDQMDRAMQRMDKKAWAEADAEIALLKARLAEAVECCTIKDNRNLWLEIRLQKIMARCADLLDEDQFNELDAMTRTAVSASGVQK